MYLPNGSTTNRVRHKVILSWFYLLLDQLPYQTKTKDPSKGTIAKWKHLIQNLNPAHWVDSY